MNNLKITNVIGEMPMNILTGPEFDEAIENLEVLRATAGAGSIQLTIDNEGKITISTDMNVVMMEAEL